MAEETGEALRLRTRAQRKILSQATAIYAVVGFGALVFYGVTYKLLATNELFAMAIGGLVGAVEILGRYRHSPFRAILTWNGLLYILINIAAAWAAYYLLGAFEVFKSTTVAKDVTQIMTAGFGSLIFMRSSVFKVRVGDSDIGIGPAAILDTLMLVADRGVDRREAVARAQDVTELVSHVRDPVVVAKMLTKYSLALMQNVDEKSSQDLSDAITKIMADGDIPDAIKIDIVALRLGVVVGPDVLEAAVAALGDRLTSPGAAVPPPPTPSVAAAPAGAGAPAPVTPTAPKVTTATPPGPTGTSAVAPSAAPPASGSGSTAAPQTTPSAADLKKEIESSAKP
jgi:hypothetical protein